MNMELVLMDKAFKLNSSTPTNNNHRLSLNPRNRQIAQPGINMGQDRQMQMVGGKGGNQFRQYALQNVGNQNGYNAVHNVKNQNPNRNGNFVAARAEGNAIGNNVRPRRRDVAYLQTQLLIAQKEEAGIQLQAEEFDLMVAVADLDEIEEVNANCILMANLQQASTSGTQTDKAPVYDSNGSVEVHSYDNCYDNEIFNMFTQEEYMEQDRGTIDQHPATVEETRAYFESLYNNLVTEVEKTFKSHAKESDNLLLSLSLGIKIDVLLRGSFHSDIMSLSAKSSFVEECKYDKISYDKAYNDMQQKIKRLQAQLGDQKGKSKDTPCVSNTLDHLSQKLENENVELEFQVSEQKDTTKESKGLPKINKTHALSKLVTSNSVPTPQESKVVNNDKVIALRMFRINPFKPSREEKYVPKKVRARVNNTAKTRRPQPRSNTKNDRVPSASKSSCSKNNEVEVEEYPRNLLLSKNKKHMSSECNHVKLAIRNDKSEVVCAMCKQCLITANHDICMLNYVNDMNSHGKKQTENVSNTKNQNKQKPKVMKPKKVGSNERLASPKPSKPRSCLRWSPTERLFDLKGNIIASSKSKSQSDCSNGDNACTSNPAEPTIKQFLNSTSFLGRLSKFFLGTVRFGNDHVATILGFGDLEWGNILITRVYFVDGLGHNLFSVGQFCDSDLEVPFRRNTCFIRNLEGVDLLIGNHTTNLYTINLHEMASTSPICLMARETSTKSWLRHQRLSYLNFDTINNLAKNDLVTGLPKFKYHKEHLCSLCEQGKSKRASHPPKPVPNSK
ncbi:retrovirus-related pol polyprotein from transposon TNT 1-94 [Tanacetum coccineum]